MPSIVTTAHFDYAVRIDSLDLALRDLASLPARPDAASAQRAFRRARAAYKRIEYLVELDPTWVTALNGPPLPTVDEDDPNAVIEPAGLQVIEGVLLPQPASNVTEVVHRQVDQMRRVLAFIRIEVSGRLQAEGSHFDLARMELARIVTLGVAGFDATLSKEGIRESAEALRGLQDGLAVYDRAMRQRAPQEWESLYRSIEGAVAALEAVPDFDHFDRFAFMVQFVNPIADGLGDLQRLLGLPASNQPSPWSDGATNIWAAGAINSGWFAPDYAPPPTPQLVALGRQLFFDNSLSRDGRRSCATCHQPARAFTDGRRKAAVDPGHGHVRNTPTLLNAGLQQAQFADQRVRFLEFQFEEVMSNSREMALVPDSAARRLGSDSALVQQFAAAFGRPRQEALNAQTLSIAVAAYVRSLQGLNSRFDRAVQGDTAAITASERRGFNLFMGKAGCGTCHFAPLFGGSQPPTFLTSEPEVIGVPAAAVRRGATVDPDPGVLAIDRARPHRHAFKTPTVRNVGVTGPYMHNGVFRTLNEVVDFYDRGGGNGLGMKLPNQTLPPERLQLSAREKQELVDFLGALTDSAYAPPGTVDAALGHRHSGVQDQGPVQSSDGGRCDSQFRPGCQGQMGAPR